MSASATHGHSGIGFNNLTLMTILQATGSTREQAPLPGVQSITSTPSRILYKRSGENGSRAVNINLAAYTSEGQPMQRGEYYQIMGTLGVCGAPKTPNVYYSARTVHRMPGSIDFGLSLANKTTVTGTGKVKVKIDLPEIIDNTYTSLIVEHCDYDSDNHKFDYFTVKYNIPADAPLHACGDHGLMHAGSVVAVNGMIVDWDDDEAQFVVQVSSVSLRNTSPEEQEEIRNLLTNLQNDDDGVTEINIEEPVNIHTVPDVINIETEEEESTDPNDPVFGITRTLLQGNETGVTENLEELNIDQNNNRPAPASSTANAHVNRSVRLNPDRPLR